MPHVDEGLLHAYLDEELTGSEREHVLASREQILEQIDLHGLKRGQRPRERYLQRS